MTVTEFSNQEVSSLFFEASKSFFLQVFSLSFAIEKNYRTMFTEAVRKVVFFLVGEYSLLVSFAA